MAYSIIFNEDAWEERDIWKNRFVREIEIEIRDALVNTNDLKRWKTLRNEVIHRNYKVEEQEAVQAGAFFTEFYANLKKCWSHDS